MPNKYYNNIEIDKEYINNVTVMCLFVYVYIYDIIYGLYMQLLIVCQINKIIHQNTMTSPDQAQAPRWSLMFQSPPPFIYF
jgi:hypothetical protein